MASTEPAQEPQGCAHCKHFSAVKCRVCGRATQPPQDHFPDATKMVQEPVAQISANRVIAAIEEWKSLWWKVPPFASKVNRATREAITVSHNPLFSLLLDAQAAKQMPSGCTTPSGCQQHGCHGDCLPTEPQRPAEPVQEPVCRADGMPTSAEERHLRRLLALRAAMPHTYYDDGEAQGTEHGISIDFMREPVAHIDAKLRALNVARAIAKQDPAFHGFMSADRTRVDLCFTPSSPRSDGTYATAYYTAPPQRKPLTEEEILKIGQSFSLGFTDRELVRAVERAHGIVGKA